MKSNETVGRETPDESLLVRYLADSATESEIRSVEEWADADTANEKALTDLALIYDTRKTWLSMKNFDTAAALRKVEERIRRAAWRRRLQRTGIAASLIVGLVGLGLAFQYSRQDVPSTITVSTNDNSRTRIELPDGTQVLLNSASSVTYPSHFAGDGRDVVLVGEAYFNVARNPKQPFSVTTPDKGYTATVLGTEFTMQAWEGSGTVETSLISGSVQVDVNNGAESRVLVPSQKAIYSSEAGELQVIETDIARETDWMYGRLVFRKTPIPEVLERLTRFYNVKFDVVNDEIKTSRFTGTFEDKPLYQVLEYMKIASGIDYFPTYRTESGTTESVIVLKK